jgi:uncharacterized protein YdaU (DUF1376 family)
MQKYVDDKHLVAMAGALENDELGGAVRLLSLIVSGNKPVPAARARIVCRMSEDRWQESKDAILEHFIINDQKISHKALEHARLPEAATPARAQTGRTPEMPIVHPTRDVRVPTFTQRDSPEKISMRRAAYDLAVNIFARSDQSSNTARAVLASLLKNWPAGDVYEAISSADKQEFLADPRGWIIAHLQRNSRPTVANSSRCREETSPPPKRRDRKIASAETMGISSTTADRIRERNAGLRIDLGTPKRKTS